MFSSSSFAFTPDDQLLSVIYDAKNPGHCVLGKDHFLLSAPFQVTHCDAAIITGTVSACN